MRSLLSDQRGNPAVEMALVLPLLLVLTLGPLELGNYFMNQHTLVKAVRDGARFAARQNINTNYPDCSTVSTTTRDDTRDVVINGYLDGGSMITPNIRTTDINVTTSCKTDAGGQTMAGIYAGRTGGAQIVTVTASVNYRPVLAIMGFTGLGLKLTAASEAAVTGE